MQIMSKVIRYIERRANKADSSFISQFWATTYQWMRPRRKLVSHETDSELIEVRIASLHSFWHPQLNDCLKDPTRKDRIKNAIQKIGWDESFVQKMTQEILTGEKLPPPILVVEQPASEFTIVDGHHRVMACFLADLEFISAIRLPGDFFDTRFLRQAEVSLKRFDSSNNYQLGLSNMVKLWAGWYQREKDSPEKQQAGHNHGAGKKDTE